jgi:hypothetical protein
MWTNNKQVSTSLRCKNPLQHILYEAYELLNYTPCLHNQKRDYILVTLSCTFHLYEAHFTHLPEVNLSNAHGSTSRNKDFLAVTLELQQLWAPIEYAFLPKGNCWEANNRYPIQVMSAFCELKVHYHVEKSRPLVSILSLMIPDQTLTPYSFNIHSNIFVPYIPRSQKMISSHQTSWKKILYVFFFSEIRATFPTNFIFQIISLLFCISHMPWYTEKN